MARFEGKGVVVTGGARGIGRAIVEAFVREGARVFVADVDAARLKQMAEVHTTLANLANVSDARRVIHEAIERLGRVDVLVNCAGVMPDGSALDVTEETFDETFAVNTRAPFFTMQEVAPHMIANGGGAIVNVASANAFRVESPEAPYNASKAALVSLTKSFAHELGHLGIRANCVAPGETITPEAEEEMDEDDRRLVRDYLRRIPMRRPGRPEEQAAAVLFLASDEASFVSGETIIVDGGELTGDWYDGRDSPEVPKS